MTDKLPNTVPFAAPSGPAWRHLIGSRTLVVSGGRAGCGATTLALNLAATLARDALRVVLVDANPRSPEIASRCELPAAPGMADVLAGRKTVHEALQRGPAGLQVLAGGVPDAGQSISDRAIQRTIKQLDSLRPHADWLIIDAGHEPGNFTSRLWAFAKQVLLVASPEAAAVMDSYALVKTLLTRQQSLDVHVKLVVNQADSAELGADVHRRIDQSCRRFLGLSLELSAVLPVDSADLVDPTKRLAIFADPPGSSLALAIAQLTKRLAQPETHSEIRRLAA